MPRAGQTLIFHSGRWLTHDNFVLEAQAKPCMEKIHLPQYQIRAWKLVQCTNILVLGNTYERPLFIC